MKSALLFLFLCILLTRLSAQTGPACTVNYQAVIRDNMDKIVPNRNVTVRLSVLDGPGGGVLYIEEHGTSTNSLGLITLEVGAGVKVGGSTDWMNIAWLAQKYFLRIEVDINGGQNFEVLGESPILAVPIAIQAKYAALSYQTIDTITKVVQTLCADTLKSKISCLDTIKAFITYLDTITAKKIYAKNICVDTIPMPVYIENLTGQTACFDDLKVKNETKTAHLEVDSTITVYDSHGNISFWVDPDKTVFETVAGVHGDFYADSVEAKKLKVDKIIANQICGKDVIGEDFRIQDSSGIIHPLAGFTDGHVEIDGYKFFGKQGCLDTIMAQKITANNIMSDSIMSERIISGTITSDSVKSKDLYVEEVSLVDGNGPHRVLYLNMSDPTLTVDNVFAEFIRGTSLHIVEENAVGNADIYYNSTLGAFQMDIDKIMAKAICTEGLTLQKSDGTKLFEFNPNANPVTEYAFTFNGNIMVNGGLMANFKQFVIDHPLDPEHKRLHHYSIESDQMSNIYQGNVILDANGEAEVLMPDWFEALNKDFTYQLTCVGGHADVYVAEEIKGNHFRIGGGMQGLKVSWQVTGIRHDPQSLKYQIPIEEWKGGN